MLGYDLGTEKKKHLCLNRKPEAGDSQRVKREQHPKLEVLEEKSHTLSYRNSHGTTWLHFRTKLGQDLRTRATTKLLHYLVFMILLTLIFIDIFFS